MEPEIRVRGYHTDIYQHVNNARYLEFLEEGRWQLFEDHLDIESFAGNGYSFIVVNINVSYKGQAFLNDLIQVKTGLLKIGTKSATLKQQIINKATGKILVDADVTFVITDSTGKAAVIEGDLKEILTKIPEFAGV